MRRRSGGPAAARRLVTAAALLAAASAPPGWDPRPLARPTAVASLGLARAAREEIAGAVVYRAEDHSLPLVELVAAVPGGADLDPPDRPGFAFVAAALLRGSGAGSLGAEALAEEVDRLGAEVTAVAGRHRAAARLSVPSFHLEAALDLFFDLLSRPRFEASRLTAVTQALADGWRRQETDPAARRERVFAALVLGPDRAALAPDPAVAAGFTAAELAAFHRRQWRPDRLFLALSGDFDPAVARRLLAERLGAWAVPSGDAGGSAGGPLPGARGPAGEPAAPGLYWIDLPSARVEVAVGSRLDPDGEGDGRRRAAAELAVEVLGGSGAVSRVAGRLRTAEGIAYRAGAVLEAPGAGPGQARVEFTVAPAHLVGAARACREEIERWRAAAPSPAELEAARANLLSQLLLALDTAEEVAGRLAQDELLGRPAGGPERLREGLLAATPEEVGRAAWELLDPGGLIWLFVGPAAEIEAPLAALARAWRSTLERLPPDGLRRGAGAASRTGGQAE